MKIQIDKTYPMPCTPEVAWEFLQNLEAVASCMPGAKITERLEPGRYKGTVTARVGPATMSFRGEVEMKDIDPAARTLLLLGKGTDSTGSSGATLNLTARIESAEGGLCTLVGASEVSMSGKAAAFGGRMMSTVADQILQQFAQNFAARVSTLQVQRVAAGRDAPGSSEPVTVGSGAPATAKPAGAGSSAPASAEPVGAGSGAPASAEPVAPVAAPELNVLALAWTIFRNWLRRLFSRSAA